MTKKFNFTQSAINTLPLPDKGKRVYYRDEKEIGLVLDVRASGSKSFYLYKKIDGKPERILLGSYPDMKILEARKACAIKKGQIANGINPQDEKRGVRSEITFGDFFKDYMERYSKPYKKSWRYDEREVNKYLSHFKKRKLSSIKKHEVKQIHDDLGKNSGIYQANRILERIRSIYSKAIEWGWSGENPATGIKKFKEKSRDRFVQPTEMPLLFHALDIEENATARDYILISLMTGARKSNVLAMSWNEISWEQGTWRIPETKNGEAVTVHLVPQAIEILKTRKLHSKNKWVFPSAKGDKHFADPKKSWDRIRQRATIELWKQTPEFAELIKEVNERIENENNYIFSSPKLIKCIQEEAEARKLELPIGLLDLRLHDLRRTFGSYQAMTGASLPIIGKTLGHKSSQSTSVYARFHDDPIKDAMSKAADAMFNFGKGETND